MPLVRGTVFPEVESAGFVKRVFDVLLWTPHLTARQRVDLHEIEVLRTYLASMRPLAEIQVHVPEEFGTTQATPRRLGITFQLVASCPVDAQVAATLGNDAPAGMRECAATALALDADVIVRGRRVMVSVH